MVIQRWQSLLLLMAAVMMGLFSFCSLGQIQYGGDNVGITAMGLAVDGGGAQGGYILSTLYIFVISLVSVALPFIGIFCFKNLRLQKRLCGLTSLFVVVTGVCEALAVYNCGVTAQSTPEWSWVVATPFVALVSAIMAWRCIRSDKKKLEGYDRIR